MKPSHQRWLLAVLFALAAGGFLLPLWPLSLLAIIVAAVWGRWVFAIIIGLLLDLAWGAPIGLVHYFYFPFTLAAVVASLGRLWIARYFLNRNSQDRL